MLPDDDRHDAKLIDRLTATTVRLRNLFYVNLILAAAVMLLVFQDPAFVSERIGPAAATLQPVVAVVERMKRNDALAYNYQLELQRAISLAEAAAAALRDAFARLDARPAEERAPVYDELARRLTAGQRDLLDRFMTFDGYDSLRRRVQGYFALDLAASDYRYLAEVGALLIDTDHVAATLERGRALILEIDAVVPLELPRGQDLAERDFSRLGLRHFLQAVLYDSAVEAALNDMPDSRDFFRAVMIAHTFCRANGLETCSLAGIRRWQDQRAAQASSRLSTPGLEVNVARELIVPASPVVFLVAFHIYAMQFRRRQVLRRRLQHRLSLVQMNLLDEPWVLNSVVLNIATSEGPWRRIQSALMTLFLVVAQAAPLMAVVVAGYYTFKQVLLGAFIADEFTTTLADLTAMLATLGVENLPRLPAPPGLFWEYLWIAVAAFTALVLAVGLVQMLIDQLAEIREAWRHHEEV